MFLWRIRLLLRHWLGVEHNKEMIWANENDSDRRMFDLEKQVRKLKKKMKGGR